MLRKAGTRGRARAIVQAIASVRDDTKAFDADWNGADSLTNLTVDAFGNLLLAGTGGTEIEHTASDGFATDLNNDSPFSTGKITWGGAQDPDLEIDQIRVFLDPRRTGAAKEVVTWRLRLWRLHRVTADEQVGTGTLEVAPLGPAVDVTATGDAEAEFIFDYSATRRRPRPMLVRPIIELGAAGVIFPITYIVVTALDANGDPAGNVGLSTDSATASVTTAGRILQQSTLTQNTFSPGRTLYSEVIVTNTPRLAIRTNSYTTATVTFSGAGNRIDLGATPTAEVECIAVGREPSDTALTFEIAAPGGAFTEFRDGDLIAVDNTPQGGFDLSALAKRQDYDIRCQLATNAASDVTPVLQRLGVRELTRVDFDRLASQIETEWTVDPFDLRGIIARLAVRLIRDGRRDFNDAVTDLFRSHNVADIAFELFIGHPELDRHKWLRIDTFPFVYDYDPQDSWIDCQFDSALVKLRAALPVVTGTPTRDILLYNSTSGTETLKDVSDDLIDGQVGLAARFRGQGIPDDTTTIAKQIGERSPDAIRTSLSDAKEELDAIAFIAGGVWSTEMGRVRFFDLYGDHAVDVVFDERETDIRSVSPGLSARAPEVFLAYDYDIEGKQYRAEHRGFHAVAITAIGAANLGAPKRLPDTVGQWVLTSALATTIVRRHLEAFSTGLRQWQFRSTYPYPELQLGDRVLISTKKFVLRDPIASRELYDQLWVIGIISGIHDVLGTDFTIWVQSLSDVLASTEAVTLELNKRLAVRVFDSANQIITQPPDTVAIEWNSETFDSPIAAMHDNVTNNTRLTAPVAGKYMIQGAIKFSGAFHNTASETIEIQLRSNAQGAIAEIGNWIQGVDVASGVYTFAMVADLVAADFVFCQVIFGPASPGSGGITIVQGSADQSAFEMSWISP